MVFDKILGEPFISLVLGVLYCIFVVGGYNRRERVEVSILGLMILGLWVLGHRDERVR